MRLVMHRQNAENLKEISHVRHSSWLSRLKLISRRGTLGRRTHPPPWKMKGTLWWSQCNTVCKMLGTSISSVLTDFFLVLLFACVLVATTTCGLTIEVQAGGVMACFGPLSTSWTSFKQHGLPECCHWQGPSLHDHNVLIFCRPPLGCSETGES